MGPGGENPRAAKEESKSCMVGRIAILGGSSVYIPEFILSLISHNVNVKEIVLHGRPGRKLDLVSKFSQRLLDRSGYPAKVVVETDVPEAVRGAKYVINHLRVGGMAARHRDETLPLKFDMIGDDTLGAGGFANAMRTLPVVLEMAEEVERVNPDAIFINLTNPMGIVVEALLKTRKLKVVGLSDLPGAYAKKITNILRRPREELRFDYVGLHHLGWIQDVKIDKRSHMAQLLDALSEHEDDSFDFPLIELFRMIPTRNTGTYFHRGEVLKRQQSMSRFRSEELQEAEERILTLYEDPDLHELPELTRQRNAVWYEETILPLIDALESRKKTELILCVGNNGSIRDMPDDASVEVPVSVGSHKLTPRKVGSLPRFLRGMFMAAKESDRLTIEAALHKSYDYALQALTINPFVPSVETAQKFLDRIIRDEKLELH
jgi:6-phospho-beta-glucosidase